MSQTNHKPVGGNRFANDREARKSQCERWGILEVRAITLLFLLSHQRSGSHFLKETLGSVNADRKRWRWGKPRYLALPEVFTPGIASAYPAWAEWLFDPFHNELLLADPLKWGKPDGIAEASGLFLERLRKKAKGQIVLVDIKLNQLFIGEDWYHEPSAQPRLLYKLPGMGKIVFLRRRNLVRTIVSEMQATQSGIWHKSGPDEKRPPVRISINIERFMWQLAAMDRSLADVTAWLSHDKVLSVFYEDLFDAETFECNGSAFDAIAKFAGLAAQVKWQSPFRKTGTHPLPEVVQNLDEIKQALAPTKFAAMLSG